MAKTGPTIIPDPDALSCSPVLVGPGAAVTTDEAVGIDLPFSGIINWMDGTIYNSLVTLFE